MTASFRPLLLSLIFCTFTLTISFAFTIAKKSINLNIKSNHALQTTVITEDKELKEGIANFYDKTSPIWLDVWGEDMHHGFYIHPKFRDHKAAQLEMIERSLQFSFNGFTGGLETLISTNKIPGFDLTNKKMVDVGCGVGGSSRYIVKKYGGSAEGLSLSPFQVKNANAFSDKIGLSGQLNYRVADAMNMPFSDKTFDLTWSMESGEHMPNKPQFVNELVRVTAPGGRIIIVTWCHRELAPGETELKRWEKKLLDKICKVYYLPPWVPASNYVSLLSENDDLEDIRCEDWSNFVLPFWPAVIRSALRPVNFVKMLFSGGMTVKGAIASWWMRKGLKKESIKFVIITARKKN